jgi:hypothetical protein
MLFAHGDLLQLPPMGSGQAWRCLGGVLIAVVALVAAGCTKELDVSKPERAIGREVERAYGVDVVKVTCPDKIKAEQGSTFRCLIDLQDDRLTANVTQTDDNGGLSFKLAEEILTQRSVASAINRQYNSTSVDCGSRTYWVSTPGRTFRCTAKDETGATGTIVVTIRDTQGNIDLDFAP